MRLLLIGLVVVTCGLCKPQVPLILLGVDGYSYDLFNSLNLTETAIPLKPVFPSKTFPNFYSIATGLYPTQHGIISNHFINKKKGKEFSYEDDQGEGVVWYKGEPIWITATKQGLVAYTDMWVGSAAEIEGVRPETFSYYNGSKTFEEKVEDLVRVFDSATKPDLFVLYYNQPDWTFHRTDISNKTTVDSILLSVESKIALLKSSLGERSYNLIIVSDHGMTSYTKKVSLDRELKKKAFFSYYFGGPVAFWYTNKADNVSQIAEEINAKTPDVRASDVREVPERWQLCGLEEEGLPEIIITMDEGTVLDSSSQSSGHGYDNDFERMWSMLRVSGPAFKPLAPRTQPLKNTELYNLFCTLLGIVPASNTGELDTFDFLLHSVPDRSNLSYTQRPLPCNELSGDIRAAPCVILVLWLLCVV